MKTVLTGAILALSVVLLSLTAKLAGGEDDKLPTIKEIMNEAHRCRTAYVRVVKEQLQKDTPDWEGAEKTSKELVRMGKLLARNTPPGGTRESWEHLTTLYIAHATILVDATQRKDMETALNHSKKLYGMCATCHRAHRNLR